MTGSIQTKIHHSPAKMAIQNPGQVDIARCRFQYHSVLFHSGGVGEQAMRYRTKLTGIVLSLLLLSSLSSSGRSEKKAKVVYVCACLGTKSCFCMTEAKMEGPCACGTQGGPPMKPVPPDSDWAKENRDALA